MTVKDVIQHLEEFAPAAYAEDFDNTGLLVGDYNARVRGILIALDTLEAVVDEAVEKQCNLIVSFHPIIFSGLKKLTGAGYVERVVMKAIRHNIAVYAIHTALDNAFDGVNAKICDVLGLKNRKILIPQQGTVKKLTTYVPENDAEALRAALFKAGAGGIGNYDHCSFNAAGTGTFRGNEQSNPAVGEKGKTHYEAEMQINVIFPRHKERAVVNALFGHHPYEEIAYEIITLENTNPHIGMGMTGELERPVHEIDLLHRVKSAMNVSCIRHSALLQKPVKKVAVLGGSGAFAIAH
ncbi:MAG: Nif3-like dinuclear metal center hexameric protein, partial [Sinomicrobium sp.]|nr:Nif3-like dinuclear metal center hexameric protein [Sinomicrobium sp.]